MLLRCGLATLAICALASSPVIVRAATVTTLAGSGLAGFADGTGSAASFVLPEGIATAPDGSLIVADTGAQRIRRVDTAGRVTTIAGSGNLDASGQWVAGGYRDGRAAQARFDQPTAVAIAPDGAIVVADGGNHCLRRIAAGIVTTYAGVPQTAGAANGALRSATFRRPMALAYDAGGTLYVADFGTGVRVVARGEVSTLDGSFLQGLRSSVTGIAVWGAAGRRVLYVALQQGIAVIDLVAKSSYLYPSPAADIPQRSLVLEGLRTVGWPYALAAVGPNSIAFTDPTDDSVRYVAGHLSAQAVGLPVENAPFNAGYYRDGEGNEVRFRQPAGIAASNANQFAIADTGNRRIRVLSGLDFRHETDSAELERNASFYRIVYVGTPFVSYDQVWDGSIASIVEAGLQPRWRELGLPREPKVFPVQDPASLQSNADLIRRFTSAGLAEGVVWQINSGQIDALIGSEPAYNLASDPARWSRRVAAILEGVRDAARARGVVLIVCINPMPFEVSPAEDAGGRFTYSVAASPVAAYAEVGPLLKAAALEANVPVVDLFPVFAQTELRPDHPALFDALDVYFSSAGASLAGQAILKTLLEDRPWASAAD